MPAVIGARRNILPGFVEKSPFSIKGPALPADAPTIEPGNRNMHSNTLRYKPTRNPETARHNLYTLLIPGVIRDRFLERHIEQLHNRFRCYTAYYPYGQWAPGLEVTDEMRSVTETFLPAPEIRSAFRRLFSLSLRYRPLPPASGAGPAPNWLDFLSRHRSIRTGANPAMLLESLCDDEAFRIRFLFEHYLPRRHGGGFNRYPGQMRFLKRHLERRASSPGEGIRCLDAACGTGEGSYDLAGLLRRCGVPVARQGIHGSTIEPLELFAAAHGFFPHDPARESGFTGVMQSLMDDKALDEVEFMLEDISVPRRNDETVYDVILCNGLLGGPALHLHEDVSRTVGSLAGRLRPGGTLLAADRFHGGWKKLMPTSHLVGILSRCGLTVVFTEEGIAARKGS